MRHLLLALLCCSSSVYACDFCGCSPALMNSDVLTLQPQSSIGTSLQYKNYKFLSSPENLKRTQLVTQNFFVSYAPKHWVDIQLSMPIIWMLNDYSKIDDKTPKLKEKKFGAGDLLLYFNYKVFAKPPFGTKRVGHTINLGHGFSFPTGSKKSSDNLLLQDFNFGTQTVAFFFSGNYSMSIKNWGLVNSILMKLNIYNKARVKYGNSYMYQLSTNYTHSFRQLTLIPMFGIRADISQKNLHNSIIQPRSGGWSLAAMAGMQFSIKEIAFNISISQPMVQKISLGDVRENTGINFTFKYLIPKRIKMTNEIHLHTKS